MVGDAAAIRDFTVEKSLDGLQYRPIGNIVPQQWNSGGYFSFIDSFPVSGVQYYRIHVNEHQQNFYSKTMPVYYAEPFLIVQKVYPNPVAGQLNLQARSKINVNLNAIIYAIGSGREVSRENVYLQAGTNHFTLNTSFLPAANYVLLLSRPNERVVEIPFTKL
jgi:hypothetical protein